MQVRWTSAAAEDLESIANYLFEKTPESAARLIREIYNVPSTLKSFPKRGRVGKKEGTRELLMPSLPVRHRLPGHGRYRGYRAYRAHPSQFAGLAAMNGSFGKPNGPDGLAGEPIPIHRPRI